MLRDLTEEEAKSGWVVRLALNSYVAGQDAPSSYYMKAEMAAPDLFEYLVNQIKVSGAIDIQIDQEFFRISFTRKKQIEAPERDENDELKWWEHLYEST